MFNTCLRRGLLALTVLALTVPASAATVTFSPLPGPNLATYTGHTEDGVTVTPTSGDWLQALNVGNPVPSILIFDTVLRVATGSINVTTGDLFTFLSFDLGTGGASGPSYSFGGYLNDVLMLSGSGTNPDNTFHTIVSPDPFQALDRLTISVDLAGVATSANLDNIVLGTAGEAVPEPTTWALIAGGLGVMLLRRKLTT